jgi:Tol biopolymer transport system component
MSFSGRKPKDSQILADAANAAVATNGKIAFSSIMMGNDEIWSIDPDGGEQRQLTSDASNDTRPVWSPDGATIFFSSNRTGESHIWQMNADGSNQTQLTQKTAFSRFSFRPTANGFIIITASPERSGAYRSGAAAKNRF